MENNLFTKFKNAGKTFLASSLLLPAFATAQITGPSSSQTPYLTPVAPGVSVTSIITVGDSTASGYKMCGLADGTGAFDNGDGTFTLLLNHEINSSLGITRAHGAIGTFVSKWVINKANLSVVSGSDLMQNVNLWNGSGYTTYNSGNPPAPLSRFCSADLPAASAFYNASSGLGTQERIFMTGEESGTEGRAFGHIVTGANAGTSYQLPWLGKMSWENAVASLVANDKTIVAGLDDGSTTNSNVYFYIGTKTNTGNEIEKAGLNNGKVFGVRISGYPQERINSTTINNPPAAGTAFDLVDLGYVQNNTGFYLDSLGSTLSVTRFARTEDGVWDPRNPSDFYFVTTDQLDQVNDGVGTQVGRSRLWKLHFTDLSNPELGGTVEAVLDGTEGQVMLDNITIDNYGQLFLQEDVGNAAHNGKIWQYNIATDALTLIAKHDVARFGDIGIPATAPYNTDEESSGIIDMQSILGAGQFLLVDQAHYAIPGELVEGGQMLALYNPSTYNASLIALSTSVTNINCNGGNNGAINLNVSGGASPYSFNWSNGSTSEDLSGLSAGTYTVTVTDAVGTTNSISATVTQPTALTVSIVPQPATCGANIGFATANPTGGTPKKVPTNPTYTYLWSDGRTLKSIGGLLPGTYTVTVTDSLGCSVSNSTVILGSAITSVSSSAVKTTCGLNNGQACVNSITGGNAPYTYSWNTVPAQTTACATGLAKGTYEVTITTADGCIFYQTVKVGAYKPLGVYILSSTCSSAKAQPINGIYPFSYVWSNGTTTKQASGLTNGTYTVTVTDGNNCSATVSVTIGCSTRELAANTEIETNFTVSPNPVVDQFNVMFNATANGNATLRITDLSGRIVKAENVEVVNGVNAISIDAVDLTAGVYSVTLITGNEIYTQKLIKK